MQRKVIITYKWRNAHTDLPPRTEHEEALEEDAMARIDEMQKEGFTEGELYTHVRLDDDDPEDGVEYAGYWEVEKCKPLN